MILFQFLFHTYIQRLLIRRYNYLEVFFRQGNRISSASTADTKQCHNQLLANLCGLSRKRVIRNDAVSLLFKDMQTLNKSN